MKKISFVLRVLLGIIILFILIYKVGAGDVFSKIVSISILLLILVFILFLINLIIRTLNFRILLLPLKKKIPFHRLFYYSVLSWSFGLFIPGKVGEFSLIPLLKKEGISLGHGSVISLLDNLATFLLLATFSIIGFLIFFNLQITLVLVFLLFLLASFFIFFIITKRGRGLIKSYFLRKYSIRFQGFSKFLFYYLKKQKALLTLNIILTFFKWFAHSLIIYILFLGYNQKISLFYIFLISSVLIIISLIPISISGFGVRESAAVLIYTSIFNLTPSIVLSTYLIPLVMSYTTATIVLLFALGSLNLRI